MAAVSDVNKINSEKSTKWQHWLLLGCILSAAAWLRYHLIDVPLERDEGEYAYGGQLLLQGVPPYKLLYNMKLPGVYAVYAGILSLFGQTHSGIHLGLLLTNLITIVGIFFLGRLLFGATAAVAGAAVFAVLSVGDSVQGVFANSEHFVILPVVVGAIFLHRALIKSKSFYLFLAGLCLGLGFVIKQHGAVFIVWAGFVVVVDSLLLNSNRSVKDLFKHIGFFSLGVFAPYFLTCLLLFEAGVFEKFWFWTFDYARAYTGQASLAQAWNALKNNASYILAASPLLWGIAAIGLPLVCLRVRRVSIFVISFAFFSFLAICPGGFFRPHYFVLLLPAAALLVGGAFDALGKVSFLKQNELLRNGLPITLVIMALLSSLYLQRRFLFQLSPSEAAASIYWPNPFNESLVVADYIKRDSQPGDQIALVGSEPQIFFYSGLRSASGYIYMYPLMEKHDFALTMQQDFIKEVEAAKPKYMIFVRVPFSWLQRPGSHLLIYDWFVKYRENYERIGMVEIFEQNSRYSWLPEVVWPPKTPYWVEILKLKSL